MNLKLTLASAVITGLLCSTAMAQTNSPNPNKAQNSAMRTQSGMYPYALYPDGSPVPGHVMPGSQFVARSVPATVAILPTVSEPIAGRSIYMPTVVTPVIEVTPSVQVIEVTPMLVLEPVTSSPDEIKTQQ